jgi:hypothetical protein
MIKELCSSVVKEGPWKALKQSLGGRYVQVGGLQGIGKVIKGKP